MKNRFEGSLVGASVSIAERIVRRCPEGVRSEVECEADGQKHKETHAKSAHHEEIGPFLTPNFADDVGYQETYRIEEISSG